MASNVTEILDQTKSAGSNVRRKHYPEISTRVLAPVTAEKHMKPACGLAFAVALTLGGVTSEADEATTARGATAVESAHREFWQRFVHAHGIMLDFTD